MSIQITGLLGFIIFVLDIWAIIRVIQSPASTGTKVLWTVLILLMPVLGLVLWFFLGPRDRA
ncbi:PLD nuclease N-terminal domain-containing protein [Neptunomonas phycophila]|uniref:PLD nuclease N-terminal domain-containing protein n=1 Tax=Neptunomonas phycophila TaxID=1572645 RepID=UPI0026E3444A|nr:PLD nuclease N-terminal domain-containing protein [Neptunomonas phycophila]MDO6466864.1 PLD nuclease N-terminal domain-containing protein [Neptunomonas phycophila]